MTASSAALGEPVFRIVRGTAAGDLLAFHRRQYGCWMQAIANCPAMPSVADIASTFGVGRLMAAAMRREHWDTFRGIPLDAGRRRA